MPESVTDRPTKAHEYLFLLAKSERYYFDQDAIREAGAPESASRYEYEFSGAPANSVIVPGGEQGQRTRPDGFREFDGRRNRRTVWTIATQPYSGAHFAVMPEDLVEPCILAGSRAGDTILDPFAGSGTVGVVALKRGRQFIGVELNPKYAQLAHDRIEGDAPLLNHAEVA
jgi:DNA modification methylase